jgi:hypothetical protein
MTTRYLITDFADEPALQDFWTLLEYAQYGRVISGWRELDADEVEDGEDEFPEPVPVYDETDRSGHPCFEFAQALVAAGLYDSFVDETVTPPRLFVRTTYPQDELLEDAASRTDLRIIRQPGRA